MKKIFAVLATLTLSLVACADNHQLIGLSELPAQAQTFLRKYFNIADVRYIERDRDGLHYDYSVYLNNATEIEFGHQGDLQSVDCKRNPVPEDIVPELITSFVTLHHPDQFIVEYAIEYRHRKVELNNGLELVFDAECHFIRIDD
jgi:hypothetical protein